jgi:transcriptional regulator with XRE-family HTH domain
VPPLTAERRFGRELRRVREEKGISQEELGFRAELHRTYVSQLERGLKSPSLRTLLRIGTALSYPASKLVAAVEG